MICSAEEIPQQQQYNLGQKTGISPVSESLALWYKIKKKENGFVRQKQWARLQIHISHAINRFQARSENTRCTPLEKRDENICTAAFLRDDQSERSMNLEIFRVQNELSSMDDICRTDDHRKCTYREQTLYSCCIDFHYKCTTNWGTNL